jgi:hypothetical protein
MIDNHGRSRPATAVRLIEALNPHGLFWLEEPTQPDDLEALARLRAAGPLGALLADQGEAHARDNGTTELGRSWPGLPDDLLNFHHDPLACAVALGWDGVTVEEVPTRLEVRGGRLRMTQRDGARPLRVVTAVDGPAFEEAWLAAVERASALSRP